MARLLEYHGRKLAWPELCVTHETHELSQKMIFPVVSGSSVIEIDGIRVAVGTPSCPELVPQLYCKFDDY